VRVIGPEGDQIGIMDTKAALQMAAEHGLDLVEISPNADPPVCRIMDYGKFKYEQEKKAKEAKKKQHVSHLKEIRMRPKIDEHDYQFKLRHLKEFLAEGDRVKVTVIFRGRENIHKEFGRKLLERVVEDSSEVASLQGPLRSEGGSLVAILSPKQ